VILRSFLITTAIPLVFAAHTAQAIDDPLQTQSLLAVTENYPAQPSPRPDPLQRQTDNIIRISGLAGLSEQARNLAQQVLNAESAPLGLQYDVVDRLSRLWAPVALQHLLSGVLTERLSDDQRRQLENTLSSRTLEAMRSKELKAISEQSTPAYRNYISHLRANPVAGSRLQLIRQLDQAMQFSALLKSTRAQVYPQLEAVIPGWKRPANWQAGLEQEVLEFLFYVHQTTPNDELKQVIKLYTRPEMQLWLSGVRKQLDAG